MADAEKIATFLSSQQVRGDHFLDSKVDLKQLCIPGLGGFANTALKEKLRSLLETKFASLSSSLIKDYALSAESQREVRLPR